jgi:hypothetical protein
LISFYDGERFNSLDFINNNISHVCWLWKIQWYHNIAYGVAYLEGEKPVLLSSNDLKNWNSITNFDIQGIPTEADLIIKNNKMKVAIRRDDNTMLIGDSNFPFINWIWTDTKKRIESPSLCLHEKSGKLLLCGRLRTKRFIKTELFEVLENNNVNDVITLKSTKNGDMGYPSIIENNNYVLISYYSGNGYNADIYVSKLVFNER